MKFIFSTLLLLINLNTVFATDEVQKLNSKIERVLVFLEGAQVSRTAVATVVIGNSEIVLTNLSDKIIPQSIQVKIDGKITIMAVNFMQNYLGKDISTSEIDLLETERNNLYDKVEKEKKLLEVYSEEEKLLVENRKIGGTQNGVSIIELKNAADFFRARMTDIRLKQLDMNANIKTYNTKIEKISAQLSKVISNRDKPTGEIHIKINSKVAANATIKVSYFIKEAKWQPLYDLRVDNIQSPLNIIYKAEVSQTSGEHWENVKLALSTANPTMGAIKPVLNPWYLNYNYNNSYTRSIPTKKKQQSSSHAEKPFGVQTNISSIEGKVKDENGETIVGATIEIYDAFGKSIGGTVTDMDGNYSLIFSTNQIKKIRCSFLGYSTATTEANSSTINFVMGEDTEVFEEVVAIGYGGKSGLKSTKETFAPVNAPIVEKTESITAIEYAIEQPYSIYANGKVEMVEVSSNSVAANYEYFSTPKLDKDAFLVAKITDWSSLNLLNGKANIYFEGTYVGQTFLDVANLEDTLLVSLGRDKGVLVNRKNLKDMTSRQFLGMNKKIEMTWEIEIRNNKKEPIQINLDDQIPIPQTTEIEVLNIKYVDAKFDSPTGQLLWKISLLPNQSKKIVFSYQVSHPKNKPLLIR